MNPIHLKYTKEHQWVRVEGDKAIIGITSNEQNNMGEVCLVELPKIGASLELGKPFGVVESVKTVSEICAPLSGTVTAINEALLDSPEILNEDTFEKGWMIEIQLNDPSQVDNLLDAAQYNALFKYLFEDDK